MTERGLKNYNKRSDYGELENTAKVIKDDTVVHAEDKDKVYLATIKCVIIKKIGKRIEKRLWEAETTYKDGYEKLILGYFYQVLLRMANLGKNEKLEIKEIVKIKPIGLVI